MYSFIYVADNPNSTCISRQNKYLKIFRYYPKIKKVIPIIANKDVGKTIFIEDIKDLQNIQKTE